MGALLRTAAMAVTGLALTAPPADAARVQLRPSGGIVVAWHGDPARGCAAAGVCDARGTTSWRVGGRHVIGPSSGFSTGEGTTPVVRVTRGDAGTCVDASGSPGSLSLLSGRGRVVVGLHAGDPFGGGGGSGRCAGPLARDLSGALPTAAIRLRGRARAFTVDLRGTTPFTAGALSGEVRSSVVIRAERIPGAARRGPGLDPDAFEPPPRPAPRPFAAVRYRVERLDGGATVSWRAGDGAACVVLDACGVAGTSAVTLAARGGRFDLHARVPLRPGRRRVTRAAALAALRHRSRVDGLFLRGAGTTAVTTTRDGLADCADTVRTRLSDLAVRRRGDALRFGLSDRGFGGHDVLESRCLGPAVADLAGRTLLAGTLPREDLGDRRLRVALRADRTLAAGPFGGTAGGDATLVLRRVRLDYGVERG